MTAMRHVGLRLSDELFAKVKNAADADRRTLNTWVTIQLERAVADLEREAREQADEPHD
jgi:hypothetical protein